MMEVRDFSRYDLWDYSTVYGITVNVSTAYGNTLSVTTIQENTVWGSTIYGRVLQEGQLIVMG